MSSGAIHIEWAGAPPALAFYKRISTRFYTVEFVPQASVQIRSRNSVGLCVESHVELVLCSTRKKRWRWESKSKFRSFRGFVGSHTFASHSSALLRRESVARKWRSVSKECAVERSSRSGIRKVGVVVDAVIVRWSQWCLFPLLYDLDVGVSGDCFETMMFLYRNIIEP